jgi:hypothetical protein
MLFTKECFQENPFGVINLALHLKILFKKFSQQHTGYYLVIFLKILSQLSIIFFPSDTWALAAGINSSTAAPGLNEGAGHWRRSTSTQKKQNVMPLSVLTRRDLSVHEEESSSGKMMIYNVRTILWNRHDAG